MTLKNWNDDREVASVKLVQELRLECSDLGVQSGQSPQSVGRSSSNTHRQRMPGVVLSAEHINSARGAQSHD